MQLHEHDVAHQRFGQIGVLAQRKGHVVQHAHIGEQRAKLEQHAHAPAHGVQRVVCHLAHVLTIKQHLPLLGARLATNQAQHGGLATARSTHQRRDFAARHRQRHIAQHHPLAIAKGDIAQLHQRRRRRRSRNRLVRHRRDGTEAFTAYCVKKRACAAAGGR